MALKLGNRVLDAGLDVLRTEANQIWILPSSPADYAAASSAKLGTATAAFGAITDASGSRRIANPAITGGTVTAVGTASHWAAVDTVNSRLLASDTLSGGTTTSMGMAWTLGSIALLRTGALSVSPGLLANGQAYVDQQRGLFLSYGMSTYMNQEITDPTTPVNTFAPIGGVVNVDQWLDLALDFGATYVLLTVKFQDGFCLFPTATTTYGIASTTWYATYGNRDLTQEFVNGCRARNLLPVFYYNVADQNWASNNPGHTLAQFKTHSEAAITELLNKYCPVAAIWWDSTEWFWAGNANGWPTSAPWDTGAQRKAFITNNFGGVLSVNNGHTYTLTDTDVIEFESTLPGAGNTDPSEACVTTSVTDALTGPRWFWGHDDQPQVNPGWIANAIRQCNDNNATILVGVPPNTSGVVPQLIIDNLMRVREVLGETVSGKARPRLTPNNMTSNTAPSPFVVSAASEYPGGLYQAYRAFNGPLRTFWSSGLGTMPTWIQIDMGSVYAVAQYMIQRRLDSAANQWLAWTFSGSNNGSSWTTLDTQTSAVVGISEAHFYTIAVAAFRYWRWTITDTQSHSDADIANLALFAPTTSVPIGVFVSSPVIGTATIGGIADSDLVAWIAAVGSGNVSSGRETVVGTLIAGLKTDGIWSKLDRIWLYAADNSQSALVDLKARASCTPVNSPTFTPTGSGAAGYSGNGSTSYINTNFNPGTGTPNFAANTACFGIWDISTSPNTGVVPIGVNYFGHLSEGTIHYPDGNSYWRVNTSGGALTVAYPGPGLFMANRSGASASELYRNGSSIATSTAAASAFTTTNFYVCARNNDSGTPTPAAFSTDQIAAVIFGGSLNATEQTALYNRLRTYMTAVGVP